MKRFIIFCLLCAGPFFFLVGAAAAQRYHRVFYEGVDRFGLFYFPGGVTAREAKKQTGAYMVLPAGYYGKMKIGTVWRNEVVGFTMIKNQVISRYLEKYGRPVFAIHDETVLDIFGSYRSFLAASPTNYQFGREADYVAIYKKRWTGRTILAKRGREVHAIVMNGRDQDCRRRLRKNRLDGKFVFLDGGSALDPGSHNPCYIAFFPAHTAVH